jgi:hypothetical protein
MFVENYGEPRVAEQQTSLQSESPRTENPPEVALGSRKIPPAKSIFNLTMEIHLKRYFEIPLPYIHT